MKAEGKGSKAPLTDSFANWKNVKIVLLALFGATAGQGVVWYAGQFWALFFLTITLKVDYVTAYVLVAVALVHRRPRSSSSSGRCPTGSGARASSCAGCLLAALTYVPLFRSLTHYVNPALERYAASTPITVASGPCPMHVFVFPGTKFADCEQGEGLPRQGGPLERDAARRAGRDGRDADRRPASSRA